MDNTYVLPPQGGYAAKGRCDYKIHLEYDPTVSNDLKLEPSVAALARMEDGNVFETKIGELLQNTYSADQAVFLEGDRSPESKTAREKATIAAMDNGVRFIWNARLPVDENKVRISEPDAMIRLGRNRHGNWAYAPVDVKHHKSVTGGRKPEEWLTAPFTQLDPTLSAPTELGDGAPWLVDGMQLAHYYRHLESLGYAQDITGDLDDPDVLWGAVIGKDEVFVWVDLLAPIWKDPRSSKLTRFSALDLYDEAFALRRNIALNALRRGDDPSVEPLASPVRQTECGECPWRAVCAERLAEADHVSLLAGVTIRNVETLEDAGISRREQLAALHAPTAILADALYGKKVSLTEWINEAGTMHPEATPSMLFEERRNRNTLADLVEQAGFDTASDIARLDTNTARVVDAGNGRVLKHIDTARVFFEQKAFKARNVEELSLHRGHIELDVDMENDPGDNGIVYLWGTYLTVRGELSDTVEHGYRGFYTFEQGDISGEAQAFVDLWDYIESLRVLAAKYNYTFRAYCYTAAEHRCMRQVVTRSPDYVGMPTLEQVDAFVAGPEWVDLYDVVAKEVVWPTERLSLKDIAQFTGFHWRDDDPSGANSVVWYQSAVSDPDPEVRLENQERVLTYNEDDVIATKWVRNWLDERQSSGELQPVSELENRYSAALV
ncbi:MAG: TM0106 family RecB-like putative nuclease [Acidimicrobiia bacterium]